MRYIFPMYLLLIFLLVIILPITPQANMVNEEGSGLFYQPKLSFESLWETIS